MGKKVEPNTKQALRFAQIGLHGSKWYDDLQQELVKGFGKDARLFAVLLAVTSPNTSVQGNCTLATKAFEQWKQGKSFEGFLSIVISQLELLRASEQKQGCLQIELVKGLKIQHFLQSILGNSEAVAVDR